MTTISDQQAYAALRAVGFDREAAITMVAVMHPESGGRIEARADYPQGLPGYGPEDSIGLWQINMLAHPQYDAERLASDVVYAAQAAFEVSGGGQNFRPWTGYTSGKYRSHVAAATAAANEVDQTGNSLDVLSSIPRGGGLSGGGGGGTASPATFDAPLAQSASLGGVVSEKNPTGDPNIDPNTGISTDPAVVTFLQALNRDPDALVRARFPAYALYLSDPELGPILRQATTENWDALRLQQAVQNTSWWRNTSASVRSWDQIIATDPATAAQQREQRSVQLVQQFASLGYNPDPATLARIVEDSLRNGWDAQQMSDAIFRALPGSPTGIAPGDLTATMGSLTVTASDYFMPLAEQTAYDWSKSIASGTLSEAAAVEQMRQWAKAQYPYYATQLDQGFTVKQLFAPMQQSIGTIMGVNPATIDVQNDPYWSQIVRVTDGQGLPRTPTIADAQRLARQHRDYAGTPDAINRAAGAVMNVRMAFQGS